MNNPAPILEAQGLDVVRAGAHLLDIPSLLLYEGDILSLIGPNGAGKTTLLQTLACLLRQFQGEIAFRGRRLVRNFLSLNIEENWPWFFRSRCFSIPLFSTTLQAVSEYEELERRRCIGRSRTTWTVLESLTSLIGLLGPFPAEKPRGRALHVRLP